METNEIMVNEDVIETIEEVAEAGSGKGFKVVAGIGLAVVVGIIAYRYIATPIFAKIKAKKEQQATDTKVDDIVYAECSVVYEDESEETE